MKIQEKILQLSELLAKRQQAQSQNQRVVFTNGCFDLLHPGHISYLHQARQLGDLLIVALNSDVSVRRLKGDNRPILNQQERAIILAALTMVDYVTCFDEDTPHQLIVTLQPDVLVKGGDWALDQIVGRQEVEATGGQVFALPYVAGASTTDIVNRILSRYQNK
jgi:D-beta-D-heptose 7-phosphate kinase/D-beta-D-heptose 1-phosphate adenosyltransferase